MSKYEHLHTYPIHPRAAAQFRAALYPSGAKDDPVDANLLLDLLVHHRGHLRRLSLDTEQTRRVGQLVEARRKPVNEKTRQGNRLTAKLRLYFTQIRTWFDEVFPPGWPVIRTMAHTGGSAESRHVTLRSFFMQHNCRRAGLIELRLGRIRQAMPAIRDAAVVQSPVAMVSPLVRLIVTLRKASPRSTARLSKRRHIPILQIFDSLPGAGPVLAPRLPAAFGSQRDR